MKEVIINRIKDYLYGRNEVVICYIFGSYSAEKVIQKSDIDIAVLFRDDIERKDYGHIKLNIINGLIELLSFNMIDIVILNIASPLLSHEVIKKGLLLFSKDEAKRMEYTTNATMHYLDTIYLRKVQDRILHEKIRSGNFGYFKGSHKYSIEKVRKGTPGTSAVK